MDTLFQRFRGTVYCSPSPLVCRIGPILAKDHFIPASIIGRFSAKSGVSARERYVYVLRKGSRQAFPTTAGGFGYVNDLYATGGRGAWLPPGKEDPWSVDGALNGYEADLPPLLDRLAAAEPIELRRWLRALIPYVASFFVRCADFSERFEMRPVVAASGLSSKDNTNGARQIEYRRRWRQLWEPGGWYAQLESSGRTVRNE